VSSAKDVSPRWHRPDALWHMVMRAGHMPNIIRHMRQALHWIVLAGLIGGSISWIRRPGDFAGYLLVGELALAGKHIYTDSLASADPAANSAIGINTWPPFFSLLCVPLALLARPTPYLARGLWLTLNYFLLWVVLRLLARMVYHADLRFRPGGGGADGARRGGARRGGAHPGGAHPGGMHPIGVRLSLDSPEIFLPLALCYRFILSNFDHLQVNIVIFACTVAALYWHTRGADLRGGIALGLAAALKVMPVVFLPYFIYRRRWRMALATTVAAAVFSLSPLLVYGPTRFVDYVLAWRRAVDIGWGVGKMNQSLFAMVDRYLGHGVRPWNATALNELQQSVDPRVALALGTIIAAITVTALVLFRHRATPDSPAALAEYGVVFIISAIFGPLTWKAYLVVLLFPYMFLVACIRQGGLTSRQRRIITGALIASFVFGGLATPGLIGKHLAASLEMLSNSTLAALVVLLTLFWIRPKLSTHG